MLVSELIEQLKAMPQGGSMVLRNPKDSDYGTGITLVPEIIGVAEGIVLERIGGKTEIAVFITYESLPAKYAHRMDNWKYCPWCGKKWKKDWGPSGCCISGFTWKELLK